MIAWKAVPGYKSNRISREAVLEDCLFPLNLMIARPTAKKTTMPIRMQTE